MYFLCHYEGIFSPSNGIYVVIVCSETVRSETTEREFTLFEMKS